MKRIFLLIPLLFTALFMLAQPPKGPASKGMTFGAKTSAAGAVNADDLPTLLPERANSMVKVKGKVVEVCKAMGCWLKMQTTAGTMMIKMKDESFGVPLAVNGKTVVAEGTAVYKETSIETLRHYAEDAGKTRAEIDAIKEPKKELVMEATGILVL